MKLETKELSDRRWFSWGDIEMYFHTDTGHMEIGVLSPGEDEDDLEELIISIPPEIVKELKKWMGENDTVSTR